MAGDVYIHGYTDEEAARLLTQAEFLAPWMLSGVDLDGVGTLLEVGIGVGAETRLLRRRWPALRVIGVDVAADQLARARVTLRDDLAAGAVELVHATGDALPLPDAGADAVFLMWVLEHVRDPARVVAECARCLRPGGRLIATEVINQTLNIEPRRAIIDEYFAAFNQLQHDGGGHPNVGARLPLLAAQAGLTVEKFTLIPVLGDARDRARCVALIRYFEGILRSAEPQLAAAGTFAAARAAEVWRAFDEVVVDPDALLSYSPGQLVAVKR